MATYLPGDKILRPINRPGYRSHIIMTVAAFESAKDADIEAEAEARYQSHQVRAEEARKPREWTKAELLTAIAEADAQAALLVAQKAELEAEVVKADQKASPGNKG